MLSLRSTLITAAIAAFIVPGELQARTLPVRSIEHTVTVMRIRNEIGYHRAMTWKYQDKAGVPRTRSSFSERRVQSLGYLRWERHLWNMRRVKARRLAARQAALPWAFWDCVATGKLNGRYVSVGEGGATSYNPAGYYGRYQMDWGFMRSHGADMLQKYGGRDARSWSVVDQTIVAERGYQVQGPGAWPHTAPPCLSLR